MATARDLIKSAYIDTNIRSSIDQITDEDISFGLQKLNLLIDQLRLEKFWPAGKNFQQFATQGGKWDYTISNTINGPIAPDFLLEHQLVRIDSVQVLVGTVWQSIKQIPLDEFFRASQNIGAQTLPQAYSLNRTSNPYDHFYLMVPSAGVWQIRIAYNGTVDNYDLDTEINLPSGYYGVLEYGTAMLIADSRRFDSTKVSELYLSWKNRVIKSNQTVPYLTAGKGTKIWSIGADQYLTSTGF